jgi:quercetin dioxygenase-like cupin family protein
MESRTCSVCELAFEVDGQRLRAGAGASAFVPRGTAHSCQNFHEEDGTILVMLTRAALEPF